MKRNLFIALAIFTSNAFAQIPTNGLVAYYPFNGNANDITPTANNGTVNGATLTPDRFGNINSAYSFNGNGSYIIANGGNQYNDLSTFSVSCWINYTDNHRTGTVVCLGGSPAVSWGIYYNYSQPGVGLATGIGCGGNFVGANQTLSNNVWYNITIVANSDSQKVYLNGQLIGTTGNTYRNCNVANLWFGVDIFSQPEYFSGKLDDIAIWNRALTTSEIQQIYNGCTTSPVASITSHGTSSFCTGDNVYLVASPATDVYYQWQKNNVNISNAKSKTYVATTSGIYRCIVTNPCGTSTSNSISLTALPLTKVTISATTSTTFCAGDSVTFAGNNPGAGYTYQWYKGSVSINGATGLSYKAYSPGSYKMVNTNMSNGCSRISNAKSVVVNCRLANPNLLTGSGFNADDAESAVHLFPNPSAGSFTLELNDVEDGNAKIELVNSLGQTVYNDKVEIAGGQLQRQLEFKNTIHGLYVLRVLVRDKMYESKVLIN